MAAAPQRGTNGHADPERQQRRARHVTRRVIRHRRIGRIRPTTINNGRVITRHINDLRVGGLNDDRGAITTGNRLLRTGLERARLLGFGAQRLDRVHHIGLLRQHSVTQLLRPAQLRAHHLQHRRERNKRLHAGIPVLLLQRLIQRVALQTAIRLLPVRRFTHFQRIGRGHQHLRHQRIGIQRNRRHQ